MASELRGRRMDSGMGSRTEHAIAGAVGFGLGGIALVLLYDKFSADARFYQPETRVLIDHLIRVVHPFMGAIGGAALDLVTAKRTRRPRASVAFALGFVIPAVTRSPGNPLSYGLAAFVGMLFLFPRRAIFAGAAFGGVFLVSLAPLTLPYAWMYGVSGSQPAANAILLVLALIPFVAGGAVLGLIAFDRAAQVQESGGT